MNHVRALLLTDIVDSTQLAETLGDDAAAALGAAHDRVARDLLRDWRGREIDKTDGMLMLFDSAADAVGCAVAYHHALAALEPALKARAGLHVGAVLLRENPPEDVRRGAKPVEVEGIAKPTAARVMSLALGGQTLITEAARAALGTTAMRVQSHGHWRIKGLAEPAELFEIGDASAPFSPPPDAAKAYRVVQRGDLWLPVRQVPHSLCAERDAFVGRQDALADLARRFDAGARLVSLLGIGGTGKTRLARRFAWIWLGEFPGGAWFCDLSSARNVDGIVHAVAQGLNVPLGEGDPVAQLGHAIAGRGPCLVILDNFEQITRYAEDTLGRWLDRSADARFLVTTREVLGLPGEEALALAPLAPGDAAALFMRRAASARRDFQPSVDDKDAIPQLTKLLDGLPLAIELAAARVRVMSPRALLSRMDQRFQLLATFGGRRDRQATLRATFDWSWELLSDAEKAALAQLSVFEGGFTLEAAEAVLDLSNSYAAPVAIDALQSLLHKSFVQQVREARFDLLVSVQEYAAEHLCTQGRYGGSGADALLAAQLRHATFFSDLGVSSSPGAYCTDLGNFIAACTRAVARGDAALSLPLLESAWMVLELQGPYQTAADLAKRVLGVASLGTAQQARAHAVAGKALHRVGRVSEATLQLEAAATLSHECGDRLGEARALHLLGDIDTFQGGSERARQHFEMAISAATELHDGELEVDAHSSLGVLAQMRGQSDEASRHFASAITRSRQIGDRQREGAALGNLALLCSDQGQMSKAQAYHEAALAAARESGHRRLEGNTLCNLGLLHQLLDHADTARAYLDQALGISRTLGNAYLECNVLCNLGIVFESLAQSALARERYEAAVALARTLGDRYSEGQFLGYLGLLHARQSRHAEALRCLDSGQALLEAAPDRIGLGVLLCSRAEAAHLAGDDAAARAAFSAASIICHEIGAGEKSELGQALARLHGLSGRQPA